MKSLLAGLLVLLLPSGGMLPYADNGKDVSRQEPTVCRLAIDVEKDGVIDFYGTCVVVKCAEKEYTVLTASHCVSSKDGLYEAGSLIVQFFIPDAKNVIYRTRVLEIPVKQILCINSAIDVAALAIEPNLSLSILGPIKSASISVDGLAHGRKVHAIGCPMGGGLVVTEGYVAYREEEGQCFCTANIYKGNSGGAVVDADTKKLIGISVGVRADSSGFMPMPITYLQVFVPMDLIIPWLQDNKISL